MILRRRGFGVHSTHYFFLKKKSLLLKAKENMSRSMGIYALKCELRTGDLGW